MSRNARGGNIDMADPARPPLLCCCWPCRPLAAAHVCSRSGGGSDIGASASSATLSSLDLPPVGAASPGCSRLRRDAERCSGDIDLRTQNFSRLHPVQSNCIQRK